ncbi:MAG: AAA family ATPase [Lachnospiraceae bacterium]|nr:AAA family ATPase [Lachnospiraceae bacterium]
MSGIGIDKIKLKNFKCHKNFEMELKNLNVLAGSNAAGKSSLVQAILLAFKSWECCEKKQVKYCTFMCGTDKRYRDGKVLEDQRYCKD